ncbi:OPA family glycerol-3-phosphate transporter-like MFS transporter [Pseudomonas sp. BIGb0408]|uniref:OPA family glycerol-3-phosphate transporter-like MFS transporter n=1 Tax=Phytopseudomonas flavescens TaxID=29435 RepID=A0A7Y9XKL1_9GAMM|nr:MULTISPECIES: MFS transporter [Pseudomonas]MCW2292335.1 OPA family glycerol-3-phosphate transporter-like MFS transporter [Pseudomonas sp. BIGb0408]NYH73093.1 OPA family glycerol-3-phosphate transporter-like MFS transporter [Pseudomonas flavescens]
MNREHSLSGLAVPANPSFRVAQWRMLLAAMFCYLFFYTGRQTFGFAIPGMQAEFGLTKETLGWISAAMLWAYAIGQAINGNLADKFGGRRIMSLGAVLSCGANWITSFATGFMSLILPWGLNGYFQALGWAPGSRLLSNWWGVHERGKVYGFYVFAAGCASILSYVTSIVVLEVLQLEWRWIFRLPVLLMLAGGILFFIIARERPQDLGFEPLTDTGVANKDDVSQEASVDEVETSAQRYKAVLKNARLIIAAVSLGFQNAARYGLIVWVPVHFLGADWKSGDGWIDPKWITVALPVGMAVGALSNGWVSDKLFGSKRYKAIMLYMVLGAATSLWMWSLPAHSTIGLVALFLCGFFVYGPASSFWALCPDLVGAKRAGTATGIMNFSSYLFAGLAEPLIGGILDSTGNTSLIFVVVAIACGCSALVALFVRR